MSKFINSGLLRTPLDPRDIPLGAISGFADIKKLPGGYTVGEPLVIKDQGDSDMCTAYALTAVSEDQEGVVLDPFFTFGVTKRIQGDVESWGADLRSACKSATKVGFLQSTPGRVTTRPSGEERENAARLVGYNAGDERRAAEHKKRTYATVNGPYDTFDNFRSALWQMRDEERSIFTGCMWRTAWSEAPSGVINFSAPGGFGHAIKIFGWDGDFLVAQLSNGTDIGDKGVFKFSREIVNDVFTYGGFTFLDMPVKDARYMAGMNAKKGFFPRFSSYFSYWFREIIK